MRGSAKAEPAQQHAARRVRPHGSDRREKQPARLAERREARGHLDKRRPGEGQAWYATPVAKARGVITRRPDRNDTQETNRRGSGEDQAWYATPVAKARGAIGRRSDRNDKQETKH